MVYEKECVVCGRMIDFGGEDDGNLPEDAMEFNGEIYCRECVREFVEFGIGKVIERIRDLERDVEDVQKRLGMEE